MYPPPAQYGYPGAQAQYQQQPQQPMYGAPAPYQAPPPQQQQMEQPPPEKKPSRLGEFGKNYGRTFVNATAWLASPVVPGLTNFIGAVEWRWDRMLLIV